MNKSITRKNFRISVILSLIPLLTLTGCSKKRPVRLSDAEIIHQNQDQLTQVIIYDVFTPTVASRLYVYSSLAAYEAIRFSQQGSASIAEKLHGFDKMPQPEKEKQKAKGQTKLSSFAD